MNFLNYIVDWSLHNRVIVLFLSFLFVIIGIDSLRKVKLDALPDLTPIQVQVVTSNPSLSALEMEQYITYEGRKRNGGFARSKRSSFCFKVWNFIS